MPEPTTRHRRQTVHLIIVAADGSATSAMLTEAPPPGGATRADVAHLDVTRAGRLAEFLADPGESVPGGGRIDRVIAAGTPVVRFDLVPLPLATEFAVQGPIRHPGLPDGHVEPFRAAPRPYRGEPWRQLGPLTYVALDVYLVLAAQAGIIIHRVGEEPTVVLDSSGRPVTAPTTTDVTPMPVETPDPRTLIHLTFTVPRAGESLCGLPRRTVRSRGDGGVHGANAPKWMLTADATAAYTAKHPDNLHTRICADCQAAWAAADVPGD